MEDNSEMINTNREFLTELPLDPEKVKLARLYLSTCEMLAHHAYQATAKQQQLNILAQQVAADNAKALYTILT